MRKFTLLLAAIVLSVSATVAQTNRINSFQNLQTIKSKSLSYDFSGIRTSDCDTFANFISCDDTFKVYVWDNVLPLDSGYLTGHNFWLDKAKADKFTSLGGDTLKGCWMWFADANYVNSSDRITVRVWDDNGVGGTPGTVLVSKIVNISTVETNVDNGDLTTVYFNTPILNPGTFYIGFSMTYPGSVYDTTRFVAMYNNNLSNACSADTARNTAWEQWSDNSWHSYVDAYGIGAVNPIFPIVCSPSAGCVININPTAPVICKGKSVSLTATGASSYSWSPSTGLNTTTGATVIAKPNTNTTYTVTGDGGACSNTVTVTVNPKPQVTLTAAPCSSGVVILTATTIPSTGVSFKWLFNNSPIGGATNSTYNATQSGTYKLQVKNIATGCKKNVQIAVTINCRNGEFNLNDFTADVYPNPFVNNIQLTMISASDEPAQVSLMDYSGRILNTYNEVDPTVPFVINEALAPGVYFIQVIQGINKKMIKVVKN